MLNRADVRVLLATVITLAACAPTLPIIKTDVMKLPAEFPAVDGGSPEDGPAAAPWKSFVRDQRLTGLIDQALKDNQELKIVEQEINLSYNEVMARRGEYLPKVNVAAGGGLEQTERFSTEDANGRTISARAGLTTSWEVDVWGRLRKGAKSAHLRYLASIEARKVVVTNLVAEVSRAYFELLGYDNQLQIIESYIAVLSKIRDMAQMQKDAARATSLAVKRFEAEVLKNEAKRYELRQHITITQNRLNQLLGRFPQEIDRDRNVLTSFTYAKVHTSVPVKMLDNRPDIAKVALELEASKLDVSAARARFYPSLSIEGGVGYEQFNSKHFVGTPTSLFYDLMAGVTAPLLNRRAIKAEYFSANNKQIQAVYDYEKTLIQAYTDVANQLSVLKNLDTMYSLKSKQVRVLLDSIEISNMMFRAARMDYVENLVTQRDALEAETELIEIKERQLAASVELYKALGGGWRTGGAPVAVKR